MPLAAKGLQGLTQARAALILGGQYAQGAAGFYDTQDLGQHIGPLGRARRGQHHGIIDAFIGQGFEPK